MLSIKIILRSVLAMLAFGGAQIGSIVSAASFDCAKAATGIEKSICGSELLSRLDDEISTAYRAELAQSANPASVKEAQREWLRSTRNACSNETCLVSVHERRLAALKRTSDTNERPKAELSAESVRMKQTLPSTPFATLDVRAVAYEHLGLTVVAKISEQETGWFADIEIQCQWRGKVGRTKTFGMMWRPGQRAGALIEKWTDGTAIDRSKVRLDSKVNEGPSKVAADVDIPACVAVSVRRMTTEQVRNEAVKPEPVADPVTVLNAAYANFDARCHAIAGKSTGALLHQIAAIRVYGGAQSAGAGSVQGHLQMLRSVGCAPR